MYTYSKRRRVKNRKKERKKKINVAQLQHNYSCSQKKLENEIKVTYLRF